ncbi:hypothetical protein BH20ACI2_BH20ACI2_06960 [soil metagenome]
MLGIPKEFRDEAGIAAGDNIVGTLERDTEQRSVSVPRDIERNMSGLSKKQNSLRRGRGVSQKR